MSNELKAVISAAVAALMSYCGKLLIPLAMMCAMMVLDYMTGVAKAWIRQKLSSREMLLGIVRKVGRLCLVAVGSAIDYIITMGITGVGMELTFDIPVGIIVAVWLTIAESLSILENLSDCGVPIPEMIQRALKNTEKNMLGEESEE